MCSGVVPTAQLGAVLFLAASAWGHVPIISDGTAVNAESAIELDDVQISRVVYHEIGSAAPQLWLRFEVGRPQSLVLRFAVPYIERLADYRPAVALIGPGLPESTLPFAVPEGLGATLYTTDGVTDPEVYDEIFSGTRAWILLDEEVGLPEAGRYYLVAYAPSGERGKVWVALGEKEAFSPADVSALPEQIAQIRAFHEVGSDAAPPCFLFVAPAATLAMLFGRRQR